MYKFEKEVRRRGGEFSAVLAEAGYAHLLSRDMVRDYVCKMFFEYEAADVGAVKIYYKPSKKSYTLDLSELSASSHKERILQLWSGALSPSSILPVIKNENLNSASFIAEYTSYVDGSFISGKIGYGLVIVKDSEPVYEENGRVTGELALSQRQVPGEIEAAKRTVIWCEANGIDTVEIAYDYLGLEKWATGKWKTNNPITRGYAAFMKQCGIMIVWKKIKSHSGDVWNDRADELAKNALS